ncbi:MAG: PKD domain-containing protein [Flavobacteriales bacterium]
MKQSLLVLVLFINAILAISQSNSVELLDGTGTLISNHNSITSAYGAIPSTITQAYTIQVKTIYTGANEVYPIVFVNKTGASAANVITLRPEAAASSITIGGTLSGASIFIFNNSDFVTIDGRPGGTGTTQAFTILNNGTSANTADIWLLSGASNCKIRYCNIDGLYRGIWISEPGSTGNDSLIIEHNAFHNLIWGILAVASTTPVNDYMVVRGCTFEDMSFIGFAASSYSGYTIVDSNQFYNTTSIAPTSSISYPIAFENLRDTAIITRNLIYDQNYGTSVNPTSGISFLSTTFGGTPYAKVANNMILLDTGASSDYMFGIGFGLLSSSSAMDADVYHNTVKLSGTATGGTAGNVNSSPIWIFSMNASNDFNFYNNVLINERLGGNEYHIAAAIESTSGTIHADYNTYSTADTMFAVLGTTEYADFASFQVAVHPNEIYGNIEPITFVSASDLHLDPSMENVWPVYGTVQSLVGIDIDDEFRLTPFRGYDEIILDSCIGMPDAGSPTPMADTVCAGDSVLMYLTEQTGAYGLSYQWQSRPDGGAFTNIDTTLGFWAYVDSLTEYRCIVTCLASGQSDTSEIGFIDVFAPPMADSIDFTNTLNTFTFSIANVQNTSDYYWDFGDGNDTTDAPSPTHTYAASGPYDIMLVISNECEAETLYTSIVVDCFGTPQVATVHAKKIGSNQTTTSTLYICPGDNALLTLTNLDSNSAPFFDYQWQSSTGGAAYTDISGANNDSLTVSPSITTNYRCVVSCEGSATEKISTVVKVLVQLASFDSISAEELFPANNYQFTLHNPQSILTFSWDFGDGTPLSNLQNPTHQYGDTGAYTVLFSGGGICDTYTASLDINVECVEPPVAGTIDATLNGSTVTFTSNGETGGKTYEWQFGDIDSSTASGSTTTFTYSEDGVYFITLIISNGCGSDTVQTQIDVLGIGSLKKSSALLYPNPTDNISVITISSPMVDADVSIKNVSGQVVHAQRGLSGNQLQLSASELKLPAGTYFIEITNQGEQSIGTWLIK